MTRRRATPLVESLVAALALLMTPIYGGHVEVQSPPPPSQAPQPGLILGRVVEGTSDRPVADALVDLRGREASQRFSALTDGDGNFAFLDVPAGTYSLSATKDGYFLGNLGQRRFGGTPRVLPLSAGQPAEVRVPLWKPWAISGTVRDDIGEPVVGIAVQVVQSFARGGRLLASTASPTTVQTDDRGVYRITGYPPGQVVLSIAASDLTIAQSSNGESGADLAYAPAFRPGEEGSPGSVTIGSAEERTGVDFHLRLGVTRRVSGRLVGDGVTGGTAIRVVFSDDRFMDDTVVAETETRPDGSFVFPQVPLGSFLLRVFDRTATGSGAAGGFAEAAGVAPRRQSPGVDADGHWATAAIVVGERDLTDVVVPLRVSAHISGKFVFDGASPPDAAAMARVRISTERADARFIFAPGGMSPRPDAGGQFATFGLPSGSYFVFPALQFVPAGWALESITLNGRNALDEPIVVEDGDVAGLEIKLIDKVSELTGSVRNARGEPDVDADVLVFPVDSRRWIDFGTANPRIRSTRVGLDGTFVLRGLPPGDYLAAAVDDEDAREWQTRPILERLSRTAAKVVVTAGSKSSVTLRTISIR